MPTPLADLFSAEAFMPHGHCYQWEPSLVALQVGSNALIGLAYLGIAATLGLLARRTRDLPFRPMYYAFGAFILSCAITHFMDVVVVYRAEYWLDGAIRAVTAVASVGTAILLQPLIPRAQALARGARLARERGVELETMLHDLEQLYERTRQLDESRRDLFASVSHELRTPLALVLGPVERLLASEQDPARRSDLEGVRRNAELLLAQVDDLLAVARLEKGEVVRRKEELEEVERARTAELEQANAALRREVEQRKEAIQQLESFAYSVSHDLRAPLRAMEGFTEALLEDYGDRLDETGRDFARRVVAGARRMERLVGDLLAYSRLMRAEVRPEVVSLQTCVDQALADLGGDVARSAAEVEVTPPLPTVVGHRIVLTQVIENLLSNALKFTRPGQPPRVKVWAEAREGAVRLHVRDEGIGIEPEHRERIFRVFERLHTAESYAGTGIGLSIVRTGVERMGGTVGLESTPGEGTTFWVELPA